MKHILTLFRPALVCLAALTVLCGVLYTAAVTGIAQLAFPGQANGSVITVTLKDGTTKEYGSELIAQEFTESKYLIGRPSGTSNLSPVGDEEQKLVEERIAWWHTFDPDNKADIPADLLTASGSGVDPNISPKAAQYQIERIAKARNISADDVQKVIDEYTTGKFLGIFGEPAVNVLKVNLALDGLL